VKLVSLFLKVGFHLLLLIAIVRATTRRDLVPPTGRGLAQCGQYTAYDRARRVGSCWYDPRRGFSLFLCELAGRFVT
jgi:hypothetical protein